MWFLIALVAPVCWGLVAKIDEYLVAKFSALDKTKTGLTTTSIHTIVGPLQLVSTLFGFVVIGALAFMTSPFSVSSSSITIATISGILLGMYTLFYFYSFENYGAEDLVPLFDLHPVLMLLFAWMFFAEIPPAISILGSVFVAAGAFMLSSDFKQKKFSTKTFCLMLLAVSLLAASQLTFKAALPGPELTLIFWQWSGVSLVGLMGLLVPVYRNSLITRIKEEGKILIGASAVNEGLNAGAHIATSIALTLAPAGLVATVGSLQSLVVVIIGIIIAKFIPKLAKLMDERVERKHMGWRIFSIAIILIGVAIVNLTNY